MMGLVSAIITGFILKSIWPVVLAPLPYLGLLLGRKASILGAAIYLISILFFSPSTSLYSREGQLAFVLLGSTSVFLLNDALQGVLLPKKVGDFLLLILLSLFAASDYTILIGFPALLVYSLYRSHGMAAVYSATWFVVVFLTFVVLEGKLPGITAEAFIASALALSPLVFAGFREVEHAEV
ncbi:hypothetical protein [Thermococcus sp.]